jgi:hypothetical protein
MTIQDLRREMEGRGRGADGHGWTCTPRAQTLSSTTQWFVSSFVSHVLLLSYRRYHHAFYTDAPRVSRALLDSTKGLIIWISFSSQHVRTFVRHASLAERQQVVHQNDPYWVSTAVNTNNFPTSSWQHRTSGCYIAGPDSLTQAGTSSDEENDCVT